MRHLPGNYLKVLKAIHIGFIAVSFGGFFAIETVILLKISNENLAFLKSLDLVIYNINNRLIYYSLLGVAATAIIYGLYSNWGVLKHHWIILKWIMLLLIAGIYVSFYSPGLNSAASLSDAGLNLNTAKEEYLILFRNSHRLNIVLLIFYFSIFFISTIKPFGKRKTDFLSENKAGRISIIGLILISFVFGVVGSINLKRLRTMDIQSPDLANFKNGNYPGTFAGGGGEYSVSVEIFDQAIKSIQFKTTRESKYVRFSEPVIQRIIKNQSVNVDAVTGATTTSKCIMKSVENALLGTNY